MQKETSRGWRDEEELAGSSEQLEREIDMHRKKWNGMQQSGTHRLSWNQGRRGRKLASGAYFVLLDMGVEKATLKSIIR
jgi:hypothetical protein